MLRLSDSFENREVEGCMEFRCLVLNINYGQNRELMEKCKSLMDYAKLIHKIREYDRKLDSLEAAVDRAIEECIQEGVLEEYLRLNRSEVKDVVLSEYDEQKHIENEKNWSREEGIRIGKEQGMKLGQEQINALTTILLRERRLEELERCLQDAEYQQQQLREYHLL